MIEHRAAPASALAKDHTGLVHLQSSLTLVGIAGEDDLDAPDLCDGPRSPAPSADERSLKPGHGQPPVQQRKPGNGQRRYGIRGERPSTLEREQSAALREKLLTAVGNI